MKITIFFSLVLAATFACKPYQEDVKPVPDMEPALAALRLKLDEKGIPVTFSAQVMSYTPSNGECDVLTSCDQLTEKYGQFLQEQANKNCVPASACDACCLNGWPVYMTFYVEPDPAVCKKPVQDADLKLMTK